MEAEMRRFDGQRGFSLIELAIALPAATVGLLAVSWLMGLIGR
jgi:prepilin-type N-terminal cleavage/methylation domain-containing protein